jgi:hypothetical protein
MFPAWAKPALVRVGILCVVIAVLLVGVKIVSSKMGQASEPARQQVSSDPEKAPLVAAVDPVVPAKQEVKASQPEARQDVSTVQPETKQEPKLPAKAGPEVGAKKEEPKAIPQPAPAENKLISLMEAITLGERAGKGEAVLAEKIGSGDKAAFNVDVVANGTKSRFNINATGKVIVEVPVPAKKGGGNQGKDRKKGTGDRPATEKKGTNERPAAEKGVNERERPVADKKGENKIGEREREDR